MQSSIALIVSSLLLALCGPIYAACSRPLTLALAQWPPYIYTSAQQKITGLDIQLLEATFAEADCQLIVRAELPRKRRQAEFILGNIDIMLAASDTPERREYSWFTQAYRFESIRLFSRTDRKEKYRDIANFADILQRKITLLSPSAGWYGEDYQNNFAALNQAQLNSPFESFSQGVKMLGAKRAELIMGDTGAIVFEAKKQRLAVSPLSSVVLSSPVHFMLSKKSVTEADFQQINAALERLEQRGILKAIRTQYGL